MSKTSSFQILKNVVANPRAVAIVIGGLGQSTTSIVNVFAQPLYGDRGCSTLSAASPPTSFFFHNLAPTAANVVKEAANMLRDTSVDVPLVIHVFSNGGAIVLEQMEVLMKEALETDQGEAGKSLVSLDDAKLLKDRLGYQFFDSSPCYLHQIWRLGTIADAFPNKDWHSFSRGVYYVGSAFSLSVWNACTLSLQRPAQFWKNMEESSAMHQIYAYTTADMLSDAYRVDKLIETRRERGVDVKMHRYEDSGHCTLFRDHTDEYVTAVEDALAASVDRARKRVSLSSS